jgi:predicted ATP-binding protein involved in virulence
MRNIIGQPVTGEDFFERPGIVKKIRKALDAKLHISFSGPVKSGKTSILLYLRDSMPDYNFVYINVAEVAHELWYYETIYDALGNTPIFNKSYNVALEPDKCEKAITRMLLSYQSDKPLVVLIDDFSVVLETIFDKEGSDGAARFLKNIREMRNPISKSTTNVNFFYSSSNRLVDAAKYFNANESVTDLYSINLPPLTKEEAKKFLRNLLERMDLIINEGELDFLCQNVQWLNPFHLQLLLYELDNIVLNYKTKMVVESDILDSMKSVVKHSDYFNQWRRSIGALLEDWKEDSLREMLDLLAQSDSVQAALFENISTEVWGIPGEFALELLQPLVNIGYLTKEKETYRFNSPLLKSWWFENISKQKTKAHVPESREINQELKDVKIEKIHIENVKCFEDVDITFDLHSNTNVIIGTNGKGKSTILQLIALGLSAITTVPFQYNWKEVVKRNHDKGFFELDLLLENKAVQLRFEIGADDLITCIEGKKELNSLKGTLLLLAYGVNRSIKLEETRPIKEIEPIATLFGENGYLKHIMVSSTYQYVNNNFETIQTLINRVLERADGDSPVVLTHFDTSSFYFNTPSNPGKHIPTEALSEGFKSTFVWLFDAIIRIVERGGSLENAKEITGIVLLDEIDLHLHPTWQRSILKSIESLFPNLQFIVTTHSPFVVQSATKECLVALETDKETGNVVVVDKNITSELSYNAIVREIFNISFPFNLEVEQKMEQYREMEYAIRDNKTVDLDQFKTLVLDIADRGVELEGIMRREIRSLEKRTGMTFDLWKR